MNNIDELKALINANIKRNGRQAITGNVLNGILNAMVDNLGDSIFLATYGTTTLAEIREADAEGMIVFCKNGNDILRLQSVNVNGARFAAIVVYEGKYAICNNNGWSTGTFSVSEVFFATYGVTTWDEILLMAQTRIVCCVYQNRMYLLSNPVDISDPVTLVFTNIDGTTLKTLNVTIAGAWSNSSIELQVLIANDLTTNDPTKALSAAQGVALKALIDALGTAVAGKASLADLNALQQQVNTKASQTDLDATNAEVSQLGQKIDDLAQGNGEDIDTNEQGKLQFANRPTTYGMGYKILRRNMTFAEQVTDIDTIYEIRYDFDLGGASVTIPAGCVLVCAGGRILNGSIVLNDTRLDGALFANSVSVSGTTTNEVITPKMFGAVCDGVTDDSASIQKMMDFLVRTSKGYNGRTGTSTNPRVLFNPGEYLLSQQIVINSISHEIDFGKAVIMSSLEDYVFFSKAHNAKYSGGIFATKYSLKFNNSNIDQGKIIVENAEFKGNKTSISLLVQSSLVSINRCKFDYVLHPVVVDNVTELNFKENWCQCPIPESNESNFVLAAGIVHIENNVLVPVAGDGNGFGTTLQNPGTEVAWIENNANALFCKGNRFSDEAAARTPVNHKKKWTNNNFSVLVFSDNLFGDKISAKKCAVRLFTFPNTFVAKNNYKGELVSKFASITDVAVSAFNDDLDAIKAQFFLLQGGQNIFYNPQFRRFLFDVDNCFASSDGTTELLFEREPEYTFLLLNYSKQINIKGRMLFTGNINATQRNYQYVPVFLDNTTGTRYKIYHLPLFIAAGAIVTITFNYNTAGTTYRQKRRFFIDRVRFYDYGSAVLPSPGVVGTYDILEEIIGQYRSAMSANGNAEVGIYDVNDVDYFGTDIPLDTTNSIMGLSIKLTGTNVGTVVISVEPL